MQEIVHTVFGADSTKTGKTIAMMLAGNLLGPDWSKYAVHHYTTYNNAVEGVSHIQLQSKHATKLEEGRVELVVIEQGGVFKTDNIITLMVMTGLREITSRRTTWLGITSKDLQREWDCLRLIGRGGDRLMDPDYLLHPDNRC